MADQTVQNFHQDAENKYFPIICEGVFSLAFAGQFSLNSVDVKWPQTRRKRNCTNLAGYFLACGGRNAHLLDRVIALDFSKICQVINDQN